MEFLRRLSLPASREKKEKATVQNDKKSEIKPTMLQKKLILECESKIDLIEIEKITYIIVDSYSSEIHFIDGSKCYSNKTLNFFESSLTETFFRINRNTIVNLSYIENVNKLSRKIKIEGDVVLCVSTRQLRSLVNHLKLISTR